MVDAKAEGAEVWKEPPAALVVDDVLHKKKVEQWNVIQL